MNPRDLSLAQLAKVGFLTRRRHGNFVDGTEALPGKGMYLPVTDPATEIVIAEAPDSDAADVDAAVDGMSSLLEPMIMAILGVLVGGLVIAMYLPIFKLGAVV